MDSKMFMIVGGAILVAFLLYKFVPDDMSPMERAVSNELPNLGFQDIDVTLLPKAKLEEINLLLFSGKTPAEIKGGVQAIINRGS
jgi:hypothetical protein